MRPLILGYILLAAMLPALSGCMETHVVHDGWAGLRRLADQSNPKKSNDHSRAVATRQTWAIPLGQFKGTDAKAKADALTGQLHQQTALGDLWERNSNGEITLYCGHFMDPLSPAAKKALAAARAATIDGNQPFASVALVPMNDAASYYSDPFNLKRYPGYYTLQIGYYDKHFGSSFRQAAEEAVQTLRKDGVEAYYYHGPFLSMITVGLFTHDQAFVKIQEHTGATIDAYAPAVEALQKKYPYNLGNGRTLIEKHNGKSLGAQPSSLVQVF